MASHQPPPKILSILVVDDDSLVREVTAGMLSDAGHRVHQAGDGREALDFLMGGHGQIDLVIADINMPRMDGAALLEQIGQRWRGLSVLLVSGRAQPPGTRAFMAKPFGWDALADAVARAQAASPERH